MSNGKESPTLTTQPKSLANNGKKIAEIVGWTLRSSLPQPDNQVIWRAVPQNNGLYLEILLAGTHTLDWHENPTFTFQR